jgi:hypothetical protein
MMFTLYFNKVIRSSIHSTNFCGFSKSAGTRWAGSRMASSRMGERGSTMSVDELQETLAVLDG